MIHHKQNLLKYLAVLSRVYLRLFSTLEKSICSPNWPGNFLNTLCFSNLSSITDSFLPHPSKCDFCIIDGTHEVKMSNDHSLIFTADYTIASFGFVCKGQVSVFASYFHRWCSSSFQYQGCYIVLRRNNPCDGPVPEASMACIGSSRGITYKFVLCWMWKIKRRGTLWWICRKSILAAVWRSLWNVRQFQD